MQISLNLAEIEALPKCIRNKSSEILNFFSAEIPSLVNTNLNRINFYGRCLADRSHHNVKISVCLSVCVEDDLRWKTTFDGR